MAATRTSSVMRWLRILLSVALSAVFLWLLLRGRDIAHLVREIRTIELAHLGVLAVLLAAGHALRILRWGWLLRHLGARVRYRDCIAPYLIGVGLNNVAPLRAGSNGSAARCGKSVPFPPRGRHGARCPSAIR